MKRILMLSVLTLAACGAPPDGAIRTELGLRGVNAAGYRAVLLDIKDLRVTADGRQLAVTPVDTRIDLGDEHRTFTIANVDIPRNAKDVRVMVTLDDAGGFESKNEAGDIDVRGRPIEFVTTARQLVPHGRADIELDLGRSLIARGAERRALVPNLSVRY